MPSCPLCQQPASKRNGRDRRGRQKYTCHPCRRSFTEHTGSAFSGYRWPADVILTAVRWYLAYPLSSRQVLELLAERGIDVSHRTVLNWVQAFAPQLAAEVRRRRRRPVGACWFVEGFEAMRHLRRGGAPGAGYLVPGPAPHARVRSVVTVIHTLGHGLLRR